MLEYLHLSSKRICSLRGVFLCVYLSGCIVYVVPWPRIALQTKLCALWKWMRHIQSNPCQYWNNNNKKRKSSWSFQFINHSKSLTQSDYQDALEISSRLKTSIIDNIYCFLSLFHSYHFSLFISVASKRPKLAIFQNISLEQKSVSY